MKYIKQKKALEYSAFVLFIVSIYLSIRLSDLPVIDNKIIESIKKTKNVITIEDGTIINGLATAVKEVIVNNNLQGVKIKSYAYPDEFIKHGSVDELEKIYGLDEENIINGVNKS